MIPVPLWAIPTALLAAILLAGTGSYFAYERGKDDQAAYQTKVDLAQAQKDAKTGQVLTKQANDAGAHFEQQKPIIVHDIHDRIQTVTIPADADPFVPVWFVRMFDRLASGDPAADTYPGQPDSAASRTRLSGTRPVLTQWVIKYEVCRTAINSIAGLKPVLPQPPEEKKGLLERLF